jgi:hypothetical protein
MPVPRPLIDKLMGHVLPVTESGCWLWMASLDSKGYAQINIGTFGHAKMCRAHRISYELHIGPIPEGLQLDHLCRVRSCINPTHLEPVTMLTNVQRGLGGSNGGKARGAIARAATHCTRGHEYTPENTLVSKRNHRFCRACQRFRYHRDLANSLSNSS